MIGKDIVYLSNLEKIPKTAKVFKDQKHLVLHTTDKTETMAVIIVDKNVRLGSIIR